MISAESKKLFLFQEFQAWNGGIIESNLLSIKKSKINYVCLNDSSSFTNKFPNMILKDKKTPGQKLIKKLDLKIKWLIASISGLLLIGFGLSLLSEAAKLKHDGSEISSWIIWGTISLIVINAGISIFGKAVVYKTEMRAAKNWKKKFKKFVKTKKKRTKEINLQSQKNPQA